MKLKDIAQQVGVSPAYLSQVRHGKRPMSDELRLKLSNLGIEELSKIKQQDKIALSLALCYNEPVLGNRLAVGRRTLDP